MILWSGLMGRLDELVVGLDEFGVDGRGLDEFGVCDADVETVVGAG